ncbi:MAG: hypothetical protein HRU75_06275 [Planctomycetia bacterium]|nr:MAG: hypothetical protein HRU75_06275 [Planctomycetia bacterium]
MTTTGIGAAGPAVRTSERGLSSLKSEDFFRILTTELQQQDPFEPSNTSDMIGQVAQIREIELSGQMSSTLDQLGKSQRTAGLADWIGKFVAARTVGLDGAPALTSGVVTSVRVADDGAAVLELDTGAAVTAASVSLVTTPENAQAANSQATGGATDASDPAKSGAARAMQAAAPAKRTWLQNLADALSR